MMEKYTTSLFFPSLFLTTTKSYGYRSFLKHNVPATSPEVKPSPPQGTRKNFLFQFPFTF